MKKVIVILFIIIFCLIGMCTKFAHEKTDIQNKIDGMFNYNYQSLIQNMWNMAEHEYDESYLSILNTDNTKYGAILSQLFQYTSYSGNYEVGNIIQILDQSSGNDSFLSLIIDRELYDKLKELNNQFNSLTFAENIREMLETRIY